MSSYGRIQSFNICVVIVGQLDVVTRVTGSPPMVRAVAVGGVGCKLGKDEVVAMGLLGGTSRNDSAMAFWNSASS